MSALLAYDGRPTSDPALEYAILYAIRFEEPLYILTVVKDDQDHPSENDVREYMQAAQKRAISEGATVHTIIEIGKPDETVVDVAERYDCSAIILGRPERSTLDRFFLGSVSDYVARNARGTVILVSEKTDEA